MDGENCYKCVNRVRYTQMYARRTGADIVGWDHYYQHEIWMDGFRKAGGLIGNVVENTKAYKESKGLWINPVLTKEVERKTHIIEKYFL